MPRMADCGGLMMGVDSIEPNTPPVEMEKVPPVSSSMESLPSGACLPGSAMVFSILAKLIWSASRSTGTTSPRGLVVPVLRDADQMSFAKIEKTIADPGKHAPEGKLSMEELTGGTFSISTGGVFGSMLSTPIINPPQSAILGIHATKERAVVEGGQIVIRPMNYFALSYDHRIIDGREAVLSLVAMKDALEDPVRLLLEL